MSTVIKLPSYTSLNVEVDSPAAMVAALRSVAVPPVRTPRPRAERPVAQPKPQSTERYFRTNVNETESVVTLSQMRQRAMGMGRTNSLLLWAERAAIGERYDSRFVEVVRISEEAAKKVA